MTTDRSLAQTVALVFGVVYLLVGIMGFIPPLLGTTTVEATGPLAGNLLGIFAVNWLHSATHLLIGVAGILAARSRSGARSYLLIVGIAYLLLFVLGLLRITLGGLLPLNGADNILHIASAVLLLAVYYMENSRRTATA
jgi:hypothetical protein